MQPGGEQKKQVDARRRPAAEGVFGISARERRGSSGQRVEQAGRARKHGVEGRGEPVYGKDHPDGAAQYDDTSHEDRHGIDEQSRQRDCAEGVRYEGCRGDARHEADDEGVREQVERPPAGMEQSAERHAPGEDGRDGDERELETDVAQPGGVPQQHPEAGGRQCVECDVLRRRGQCELEHRAHHGRPHGAGRESGRRDEQPDADRCEQVAHQVPAVQQRQPPQHEVDQCEDDARVQSRDGQQVRQPAARIDRAQLLRDAAPVARDHGAADGARIVPHPDPLHPLDSVQVQGAASSGQALDEGALRQPQRSGEPPACHQPAVTFRSAAKRPHRTPAADSLAGVEGRKAVGIEHYTVSRGVPGSVRRVAPRYGRRFGRGVASAFGGDTLDREFVSCVYTAGQRVRCVAEL